MARTIRTATQCPVQKEWIRFVERVEDEVEEPVQGEEQGGEDAAGTASYGADQPDEQRGALEAAFGADFFPLGNHAFEAQRREHGNQHQCHHERGDQRIGDGQG